MIDDRKPETQIVKATTRGAASIQSLQEYQAATADLSQAQLFVLSEIAAFTKPSDIRRVLDEAGLGDEITDGWLEAQSSPAKRSAKYRGIIEHLRGEIHKQLGDIPIASPIFRLKELDRIAKYTDDDRIKLVALKEAHLQRKDLEDGGAESCLEKDGGLLELLTLASRGEILDSEPVETVPALPDGDSLDGRSRPPHTP